MVTFVFIKLGPLPVMPPPLPKFVVSISVLVFVVSSLKIFKLFFPFEQLVDKRIKKKKMGLEIVIMIRNFVQRKRVF